MTSQREADRSGRAGDARAALIRRFAAFALERHPFAVAPSLAGLKAAAGEHDPATADGLRAIGRSVVERLRERRAPSLPKGTPEPTPGVDPRSRFTEAVEALTLDVLGFFEREAIRASLSAEEKCELLRGMIYTRAVDNRLKAFFQSGEVRYGNAGFQGKGFRSLGQEAIYGAALRLRRGRGYLREDGTWGGDVVAPLIRDLGAALGMRLDDETIRMVLNAQMGKAGPPMDGRDFHIGDFGHGILPATAPLSISALTCAGLALAFAMEGGGRVAVSFIGEGGSSLGEWHEAINACAARRLPAVFCIENNQTALATPVRDQSAVRVFADKGIGYGMPAITLDGNDPESVASGFAWAADRARAGLGPTLIELVSMRMCGHAHHDDMLYLGKEPKLGWGYPEPSDQGYVDERLYAFWSTRDPIETYAARLVADGVVEPSRVDALRAEASEVVERQARLVVEAEWPAADGAGARVLAHEPPRLRIDVLNDRASSHPSTSLEVEAAPEFTTKGRTFLEAVMLGVGDALDADPRTFVYGEDVGGTYGNAFLLLRPLLDRHGDRILNSILGESAVIGVCTGAALAGRRPIGEIQFNDFVATGFNQLVNNAAKIRYRWNGEVPMVLRMPWGGLRSAGPYHSQNTEPWFYRTPGLKIVVPSTPYDARALMAAAVRDPDPVLYYEHIALYRDPRVKQALDDGPAAPLPIGKAALRRKGDDIAIVSYGAYVHVATRVAERLAKDGIDSAVLDLRSLSPLDRDAILAVARHCGKLLVVHEDSRTGGIGESVAAIVQERAFEYLDAPVVVVGALDAPVPYAPSLERAFLPGEDDVERVARQLVAY